MKGAVKRKVVTSGRLTGGVRLQPGRRRVPPKPGPAAGPEPAYSLYSTDSEDQVTTLHKGLDRCAALLGDLLQAENTEATSGEVKGAAAKSTSSTSLAKKSNKKPPTKTDQKNSPSVHRAAGGTTPRTPRLFRSPAAHSGVTLHPPQKHHRAAMSGPPQASRDGEHVDCVPVRDTNTQTTATDPQTHTCTTKMSDLQQPAAENSHDEEEVKLRTVQYLLGELKTLIVGQGSVAEKLLSHLEQTVSSPLMNISGSKSPADGAAADLQSLHMENTQLRRRVKMLNQQLKLREEAERQQSLCDSQVSALQQELTTAQTQLQELQDDLAELRKALRDKQSQLRDREAENTLMKTELEATRSRLLHSEQEKSELVSQQRLEEMQRLNRILRDSSADHSSVPDVPPMKQQHRQDPPADHITHYLMSLDQLEPPDPHTEAATREGNAAEERKPIERLSHPDGVRSGKERRRLFDSTLSQCDVESVTSDWSVTSGSSFNTRDEAAFRDGLAALDASIASLQKTIKVDLGR